MRPIAEKVHSPRNAVTHRSSLKDIRIYAKRLATRA